MKVGLLHYSGPPTVGGVEQTLYFHSRALAELGHQPRLLVGQGEPFDPRVEVRRIPQLFSGHPEVLRVKAQLDTGNVTEDYRRLRAAIEEQLSPALAGLQALIVHNALTLHKNLALTATLHTLHIQGSLPRLVGWHHDFAWEREGYLSELHPGEPWELLRQAWPGVTHVVVSDAQRQRLASLYAIESRQIAVVPPGFDPELSGRWTEQTGQLVRRLDLLQADVLLLLPARITRRKNIEYALRVLATLIEQTGADVRLLVTGPPGPHNPSNQAYLERLLDLRAQLQVEQRAHFLHADLPAELSCLSDESMASLYALCDALLFPSLDEGYGIPLLEAAFARLPSFCSDLPALQESGGEHVHYFSTKDAPEAVAGLIQRTLSSDPLLARRRQIRRAHTWERLVADRVMPILESADG